MPFNQMHAFSLTFLLPLKWWLGGGESRRLYINISSLGSLAVNLTLDYMGYFDYLFYMGGGGAKKHPGLTLACDFR